MAERPKAEVGPDIIWALERNWLDRLECEQPDFKLRHYLQIYIWDKLPRYLRDHRQFIRVVFARLSFGFRLNL